MKIRFDRASRLASIAAALLTTASVAVAQNYPESGDAGSSVFTAQGTGAIPGQVLSTITGTLATNGDADFFVINITNFAAFMATTVAGSSLDTMLYLFDSSGNAIYLNDDAPGGASLQSTLPAASGVGPQSNGTFILGVSLTAVNPVNGSNQAMFASPVFSTDVLGPSAALGPVTGVLDSNAGSEFGAYIITLTGAVTALAIPEPSSVALLVAGGIATLAIFRRRRS